MDPMTLTADALLKIPVTRPELLYSSDLTLMKTQYRKLASHWHPDKGGSADVFAHIKLIFEQAETKIMFGTWETPNEFMFTTADGTKHIIRYNRKHKFELGEYYVGSTQVVFSLEKVNADLVDQCERTIKSFKYKNSEMEHHIGTYLPTKLKRFETSDRVIVLIPKIPQTICLRDLLEHQGGKIDPKHVAWIVSRLYNLACYFQVSELTHNDISIDTLFLDPANHTVSIIGGWWYSREAGQRLIAASSNTMKNIPSDILHDKIADPRIDLNLIRSIGRTLLGDSIGNKLVLDKTLPSALVSWFLGASNGDAIKDYRVWQDKVLKDSFGVRKFVPFEVSFNDVYSI